MLGRILIAGMASLFMCVFLGPRFIEYLRRREFGQHIREEGPSGHAVKAGTPTMGGIVLFVAVSVPFLILSKHDRASMAAIVMLAYTAMTLSNGAPKVQALALICACLVGASVGFLWFNSFPAAIFMGDTGSLGLGGAIAATAVMTQTEVLLIIIGGIFVIEALSVLIQVFSFQRFRKRVFLMAPVHHHFELMAWSETKIILRFWIVAAICSSIGFTLYQQSVK